MFVHRRVGIRLHDVGPPRRCCGCELAHHKFFQSGGTERNTSINLRMLGTQFYGRSPRFRHIAVSVTIILEASSGTAVAVSVLSGEHISRRLRSFSPYPHFQKAHRIRDTGGCLLEPSLLIWPEEACDRLRGVAQGLPGNGIKALSLRHRPSIWRRSLSPSRHRRTRRRGMHTLRPIC
jgi:hypothetical protein